MHVYAGQRCRLREPPPARGRDGYGEDFRELFGGPHCGGRAESDEDRAARLAAARDVLAELLHDATTDDLARENARYALRLASAALAPPVRVGEAA